MIEVNGKLYSYSTKFIATAQRRGISMDEIEMTLREPDTRIESEHDPRQRFLYQRLIGSRWITVVVDESELMLVTVWGNLA